MFLLTSLNRVKTSLGISTTDQDGVLLGIIPTASNRIAKSLKRLDAIEKKSRAEHFSPFTGQRVFRPKAYPIASVTSIYVDSTGLFAGGETLIPATSYFISEDARTIIFTPEAVLAANAPFPSPGGVYPKSLRITYIGGLAPDPVLSTWVTTVEAGGTMEVGQFIQGARSKAVGIITARAALSISYECLFGAFQAETITAFGKFENKLQGGGLSDPKEITATLVSVTSVDGIPQLSLAEAYTDLVSCAEDLIRYTNRNRDTLDLKITGNDGSTKFTGPELAGLRSIPKPIADALDTYQNKVLA